MFGFLPFSVYSDFRVVCSTLERRFYDYRNYRQKRGSRRGDQANLLTGECAAESDAFITRLYDRGPGAAGGCLVCKLRCERSGKVCVEMILYFRALLLRHA